MPSPISYRALIEAEANKATGRSVVHIFEWILNDAHTRRASDIHIDVTRSSLLIRLRIDGLLKVAYSLPIDCHAELIARLKIISGLRTDERFKPHDGRFSFSLDSGDSADARLSILPTYYGENAVLRILPSHTHKQVLADLGLSETNETLIRRTLSQTDGLVLVTGPTGSGKTKTLYSLLDILSDHSRSIITIEDPVECALPGITQIPVQTQSGITFASGLRSVLRQDPDVIMIGEIRDAETAALAVQAALTGHLVLSTLHTGSAEAATPRLIDMGITPYLLDSTLRLVVAQRLVRTICTQCGGSGCEKCTASGVYGRIGIFELLPFPSTNKGICIRDDGLEKVRQGYVSMEELNRVLHA